MTLTLPTYRNSFHLAWLLLLVPPLAAILVTWSNDNPPEFVGQGIRLILSLAALVPLIWLRSDPVAGRTQRLLKELRTLLPGCLLALVVPGLLALRDGRENTEWAVATYGFGCLLMSASAFGSEFEQRTIAGLLGQPLSRSVLFLEKLGTLGLLLAFATVNLLLSLWLSPGLQYSLGDAATVLLIPVFAFCSGPLFSLLSRSTLAGLIFTLTVPFVLLLGTTLALQAGYRFTHPGETPPEAWFPWLIGIGTPVYLLATATLGWRTFRTLEIRDGGAGGRSTTGLHPLSQPIDRLLAACLPAASGGARLVRKELRLHVVPWLVAGIMVGLWLLFLALRRDSAGENGASYAEVLNDVSTITVFAGLLGALVLVAAGAACVAEERELGTLEWQLTQPVPLLRQWLTKVAVAAALALALGLLLPAVLIWASFDPARLDAAFGNMHALGAAACAGIFLMVLATSIYASSVARNTMMAVATAAGVGAGFAGLIGLVVLAAGATMDRAFSSSAEQWGPADVPVPAWAPSQALMEGLSIGFAAVTVALFVATLLWLGGRNCRRLVVSARDVSRQLAGVALGLLLVLGVFGAIMVQLVVLVHQADQAGTNRLRRVDAVNQIRTMMSLGWVTPEVYQRFGAPTNSSPETFLEAVLAKEGRDAVYRIEALLRPLIDVPAAGVDASALDRYRMDPMLARRYGLLPALPRTNAAAQAPALDPALAKRQGLTPGTNAVSTNALFRMDPALARRYGLLPATPKTNAAPARK